ncbi:MAG: hypothetical protein SVX43_21910, partial [Cyanobacteriota bacterium]|nr:hypothetical protein [Cyanobacteriota bacterium]
MLVPIWSPLSCAITTIEELNCDSQILAALYKRVKNGAELADQYDKTWHSIFWKTAKAATKQRVRNVLDRIAWNVADIIYDALKLFNVWCDEQEQLGNKITKKMLELRLDLTMAEEGLRRYHGNQLSARQLDLFDVTEYEVSNPQQKRDTFPVVQRWLDYWTERLPGDNHSRWKVLWEKGVRLFNSLVGQQLTLADIVPREPAPIIDSESEEFKTTLERYRREIVAEPQVVDLNNPYAALQLKCLETLVREGIAIHTPARDNTLQVTFQHPVHRRLESLALRKARKVASILK